MSISPNAIFAKFISDANIYTYTSYGLFLIQAINFPNYVFTFKYPSHWTYFEYNQW